jgi:hypothetical protein
VAVAMGWDLRDQLAANSDLRARVEAAIAARSR